MSIGKSRYTSPLAVGIFRSLGVSLCLLCLPAFGNTAADLSNLDWRSAVRLAETNNPELHAALENLKSAEAKNRSAYSAFLPTVRGNIGYESTERSGTSSVPVTTGTGWTAGLQGNLNLFAGFGDHAKLEQADADLASAHAALRQTRAKISQELKTAFESNVFARDSAKLSGQILKRREENSRLVQLRFESGRENKGSVLLSEAYLEQARYDDLQANNSVRTSTAALGKVLGLEEIEIEKLNLVGHVPTEPPPQTRPDLQKLAESTPDYLVAKAQAESAAQAKRVARAAFLPSLDLSANLNGRGNDFFPDTTNTQSVGLSLSIPLFTGGKNYYGFQSTSALASAADLQRENVLREQRRKLEAAWASYLEANLRLKADESFQKASVVRAEIARTRYNNGLLSFEDWDVIENDLIIRQRTILNTKRDRVSAEAAWEQAQGTGVWK